MEKQQLIINPELRDLLPPLSPAQFEKLEAEIVQDGCTDPLILWNDILIDGHNRYEICTKHKIEYQTTQKKFSSLDEVKLWMWTHQDGRRNLTLFGRVEFSLKIKHIIAAKSKERQGKRNDLKNDFGQNSARSKKTRQQLAEFANVSHDTVDRVEYILAHADQDTINKLRWEAKGISINKVFNDLKAAYNAKQPMMPKKAKSSTDSKTPTTKVFAKKGSSTQPALFEAANDDNPVEQSSKTISVSLGPKINETFNCGVKFEPDPDDDYYDWITDEEREELYERQKTCPNKLVPQIHNFTIQNIPEHKPDQLINCLCSLFKPAYREKVAFALLRRMREMETDKERAQNVVTTLFYEFQNR